MVYLSSGRLCLYRLAECDQSGDTPVRSSLAVAVSHLPSVSEHVINRVCATFVQKSRAEFPVGHLLVPEDPVDLQLSVVALALVLLEGEKDLEIFRD